jgi:predicted nucleic acid-binding protein
VILVDTSVWAEHLRSADRVLSGLLTGSSVFGHPWVTGELALGNLGDRVNVIRLLQGLPQAVVAHDGEVLRLVEQEVLSGSGIGYVDAQLLAATRLTPGAALWTRDKRLSAVASRLGVGFLPA